PRYIAENAVEHFPRDPFVRPYLLAMTHARSILEINPPFALFPFENSAHECSSSAMSICLQASPKSVSWRRCLPFTAGRPARSLNRRLSLYCSQLPADL